MSFTQSQFDELPEEVRAIVEEAKKIGAKCDTWLDQGKPLACVYGMAGEHAKELYAKMVEQGWHPVRENGALVWGSRVR